MEGDCRELMSAMNPASVDAIVTDPPYGLSFMGKGWDHAVPGVDFWAEALRVAKPGAYLVAFGGTRLFHRLTCAIEDAGWEVRDCLMWLYGSGFPKSLNVSKAIDAAALTGGKSDSLSLARANRDRPGVGRSRASVVNGHAGFVGTRQVREKVTRDEPMTEDAKRWDGWGTALKPAWEPIILARKPLDGTVAANVLEHGTGAINVDACRVETDENLSGGAYAENPTARSDLWVTQRRGDKNCMRRGEAGEYQQPSGRWPANVVLDEAAGALLDEYDDTGGASRFFYCAKAGKADRGPGNNHPTVKPADLMAWLCRLVTPPDGLILDPFCGSGSTGVSARRDGFRFVGCELNPEYADMARNRIEAADRGISVRDVEAGQRTLFDD